MLKTFTLTSTTIPVKISYSIMKDGVWENCTQQTTIEFNRLYAFRDYLIGKLSGLAQTKETEQETE